MSSSRPVRAVLLILTCSLGSVGMAAVASLLDDRLAVFTNLEVVFSVLAVALGALHVVCSISMQALLWLGSLQIGIGLYLLLQTSVALPSKACESAGDGSRD